MSLVTGAQLRAARAMVGMSQEALAAAAGVTPTTVRRAEGTDDTLRTHPLTVRAFQTALEQAGVTFLSGDAVGVVMKRKIEA